MEEFPYGITSTTDQMVFTLLFSCPHPNVDINLSALYC